MLVRTMPPFLFVFLTLIYKASCQGASLTFVIDNSNSMKDDIAEVKDNVDSIMDIVFNETTIQISNILLISFNNPDNPILQTKTRDRTKFKQVLENLPIKSGGKCSEKVLSGVELALNLSLPSSYIFVFTDAAAKDYDMNEEIQDLCQKKESEIVFVTTGDCGNPYDRSYQVYYNISTFSSGLVIRAPNSENNNIKKVLKKFVEEDIKGPKIKVAAKLTQPNVTTKVSFWIDDLTKYALVSVSGANVNPTRYYTPNAEIKEVIWLKDVKVLKITYAKPGKYSVTVKSKSASSVVITGRSDFYFHHGFSEQQPKSLDDTTAQPISDTHTRLSFLVTDPTFSVRIKTAQILDMNGNIIYNKPLKELWVGFYITEPFIPPSYMFKIALTGEVIQTGNPIRRIANIPITGQVSGKPVAKAPVVEILEGSSIEVARGSEFILTCKVSAYPEPEITWTNDKGDLLPAESSRLLIPYDYISYLKISKATEATYYCHARNSRDNNRHNKAIDVITKDPFIINAVSEDSISCKIGTEVNIKCNITSELPMKILWYHMDSSKKKNEIAISEQYTILSNGAELKINRMDVGLEGEYTCNAILQENPDEHVEHTTQVVIDGLVPPKIDPIQYKKYVREHMSATIQCKIVAGVPEPKISWQMKAFDSSEYQAIAGSGSELRIKQAALANDGQYKCIAENTAGRCEHVVAELVVLKAPAVTIVEGASVTMPYGSRLTLECRVTANPKPTDIVWKDSAGNTLLAMSSTVNSGFQYTRIVTRANMKASDNYTCSAINDQGSTTESIQVSVSSAFMVHSFSPDSISGKYGTEVNLKCNITSELPMEILWYHKDSSKDINEIAISEQYTILSNGAELKINKMVLGLEGEYTCNAFLQENPDEHVEHTTQVVIDGLVPPQIDPVYYEETNVGEHMPATITCKIVAGVPEPTISWQMKALGSSVYRSIAGSGSELRVEQAALANGGHYKCIAKNAVGRREQVVAELMVLKAPAVTIVEGASMDIPYGNRITLECRVTANPKPTVVWKDSAGNTIIATSSAANNGFVYTHILTRVNMRASDNFSCSAINDQGSSTESIRVSVSSPFMVHSYPPDYISGKYGTEVNLQCNITSKLPMVIRWYHTIDPTLENNETKTTKIYTILSNGTELKINSMDDGLDGQYTCKAFLQEDPRTHVEHTTVVQLERLRTDSPPEDGTINKNVTKSVRNYSYNCLAPNNISSHDKKIQVVVVDIVTKSGVHHHMNLHKNQPIELTCGLPRTGSSSVKWFINGEDMHVNIPRMTIPNAEEARDGNYTCNVTDVHGSASETFVVNVGYPPSFKFEQENTVVVWNGNKEDYLRCDVQARPHPGVEWMFNDKLLVGVSSYSLNIFESGVGHYRCRIKNPHGEVQREFEVKSGL